MVAHGMTEFINKAECRYAECRGTIPPCDDTHLDSAIMSFPLTGAGALIERQLVTVRAALTVVLA